MMMGANPKVTDLLITDKGRGPLDANLELPLFDTIALRHQHDEQQRGTTAYCIPMRFSVPGNNPLFRSQNLSNRAWHAVSKIHPSSYSTVNHPHTTKPPIMTTSSTTTVFDLNNILPSPSTISTQDRENIKWVEQQQQQQQQRQQDDQWCQTENQSDWLRDFHNLSLEDQGMEISLFSTTSSTDEESNALCPAVQELIDEAQQLGDEQSPWAPQQESGYQLALCLQEMKTGFYSSGTCQVHHVLAWHFYRRNNFSCALTHLLQCLKISMDLDYYCYNIGGGTKDSMMTLVIMDDIQDVLHDMQLTNDFVNRVIHSWDLQDEATEAYRANQGSVLGSLEEERILRRALATVPIELDLEQAGIYARLAHVAIRQGQYERALNYYRKALRILPQWLTNDHPQVVRLTKEAQIISNQLVVAPVHTPDRLRVTESRMKSDTPVLNATTATCNRRFVRAAE
jgi:tetratricopeptide (TPR) repeat protein